MKTNTLELNEKEALLNEIKQLKSKEYLKSYSQVGEDKLINFIMYFFAKIDTNKINYIDIGANHPLNHNNTYFFYQKNGHGILIEPNNELCELARQLRPLDIVVNAGIKFDERDSAPYYKFSCNALNTFDKNRVEIVKSEGHTFLEEIEVPLLDINQVIGEKMPNTPIDLISIDAEGVDFKILKTLNFEKYRPKMLCIEASKPSFKYGVENEIITYMEELNYVLMGDTTVNYIFLDKDELK